VPVGTANSVTAVIADELGKRPDKGLKFSVVSNLGFLKKDATIGDFNSPDRIVFDTDYERTTNILRNMYAPFQRNHDRAMVMNIKSYELTKYEANVMLATWTSFTNELATFAEKLITKIEEVRKGIGSGQRIGYRFLYSGCGSCFCNDVRAIKQTATALGMLLKILQAVEDLNHAQKPVFFEKITGRFGSDLIDKSFAIWALTLKPTTDDVREANSDAVLSGLWARGARVPVCYPVAMQEIQRICGQRPDLRHAQSAHAALNGADTLLVAADWKPFKSPDLDQIRTHRKRPIIFAGHNLFEPSGMLAMRLTCFSIGRASLPER